VLPMLIELVRARRAPAEEAVSKQVAP
jgi:hypothetical protein